MAFCASPAGGVRPKDFDQLDRHEAGLSFFSQLLSLIMSCESVDDLIERAVHHQIKLVNSKADAVIGNAVIFEIVSADLF